MPTNLSLKALIVKPTVPLDTIENTYRTVGQNSRYYSVKLGRF